MFSKLLTIFTLLLVIVIILLVGYALNVFPFLSTLGKKWTPEDVRYIAAIITSDAYVQGEAPKVREAVGKAALRYALRYGQTPKQIFLKGLTLVPPGYNRILYVRKLGYVQNEAGEDWDSIVGMAEKIVQEAGDKSPPGCATHYIRAPRYTDFVAQPESAKQQIQSTMKSEGRVKNDLGVELGATEFFCPKS